MLEVKNLTREFENRLFCREKIQAVKQVSFRAERGMTLGIAGNSGCGKSTLVRMIAGLLKPTEGEIYLDGMRLDHMKSRREISRKIQLIFQHPENALDPSMRIRDSLLEPLKIHGICGRNLQGRQERMEKVMELAHIGQELLSRYPHQISGGGAAGLHRPDADAGTGSSAAGRTNFYAGCVCTGIHYESIEGTAGPNGIYLYRYFPRSGSTVQCL